MWSVILFIIISFAGFSLAYKNYKKLYRNIILGKPEKVDGNPLDRWKKVVLIAFGQKKMFKMWKPAVLHFFIYAAFLLTQLELIEIVLDGLLHRHRIFASPLGNFYTFLISFIEVLSFLALVATLVFLWRRNVQKVDRFEKPEMVGWPKRDANLILIGELLLIIGIMSMNGAERVLAQISPDMNGQAGHFLISRYIGPALFGGMSISSLHILERGGWWLHYLVVLGFLNYLPFSKHLHIFLAFINVYYSKINPRGEMENMPVIMNEVKSMLGLAVESTQPAAISDPGLDEFGAKDVFDLSQRILLGAHSCTECGRCTMVCPANITGKKLSPRKIMMDIRDRMQEIGKNLDHGSHVIPGYEDGKSLFSYISAEELHACTTCQACVEACPVLINPMEPILELRRNEILSQSKGPASWTAMFNSLENNGCVWPMSQSRTDWANQN